MTKSYGASSRMADSAGGFVSTHCADSVLQIHRTDCEKASGKTNRFKPSISQVPAWKMSFAGAMREQFFMGFILFGWEHHKQMAGMEGSNAYWIRPERFLPMVINFLFAKAPLARGGRVQPVERFTTARRAAGQGGLQRFLEGFLLFRLNGPRVNRDEQRCAAAGNEVEILPVKFPRRLIRVGGTVRVAAE